MPLQAPEAAGPSLDEWLDGISDGFEAAAGAAEVHELPLRVAERPVRILFAGRPLREELGRAVEHLAARGDAAPELTVHAWDSDRVAPPPLPEAEPGTPRGAILYSSDGRRSVAYQVGLGQLSAYDRQRGRAWFWCRSSRALPFWEPSAPFRQILHWWLGEHGLLLLHGAAVGREDGGLLLVGRGGSGKSTCALVSLAAGLLYAGDDYLAVAPGAEPRVHGLYCSGKLEPGHSKLLRHLPAPGFEGDAAADEKSIFYLGDGFRPQLSHGFPLRAIVAPVVRGGAPRLERLGPAQALAALAPSTLLQLVPARQETLSAMAALLERVPAYRLEVGGPVEALPAALERILEEIRA